MIHSLVIMFRIIRSYSARTPRHVLLQRERDKQKTLLDECNVSPKAHREKIGATICYNPNEDLSILPQGALDALCGKSLFIPLNIVPDFIKKK